MADDAIDAAVLAFGWLPRAREAVRPKGPAELIQAANDRADRKIERWREGMHLRDIGVDPDRVIEGETVRKEVEG